MPDIDLKKAIRNISEIKRYSQLQKEHFWLKFEIEHCEKCGKKL